MQLFSISVVNLIEEWHWLRVSRKLLADVLLSMMVFKTGEQQLKTITFREVGPVRRQSKCTIQRNFQ